jgi:hypothetical protein
LPTVAKICEIALFAQRNQLCGDRSIEALANGDAERQVHAGNHALHSQGIWVRGPGTQCSWGHSARHMSQREGTKSGLNFQMRLQLFKSPWLPPAPPLSMLQRPQVEGVVVRVGCTRASPQFRLQLMSYAASMQITL